MAKSTKSKGGRPCLYAPEVIDEVCERLSKGEPLAEICRTPGFPSMRTINDWRSEDGPLPVEVSREVAAKVARARDSGFDMIAQSCLRIIDEPPAIAPNTGAIDGAYVSWVKAKVDTRLKLLACWDPRRYGNKIDLTSGDKPIQGNTIHITREVIGRKE